MWLEDYLSKWNKMLFMVCHSQDFLNNVCTHIVHLETHTKTLKYYRYVRVRARGHESGALV